MATGSDVRNAAKGLGLIQHKDKSDSELQQIIVKNARIVAGLGPDARSVAQGYQLLGESDACNELLSQRQENRERVKNYKNEWRETLQKRRDDALLSLRAAATPNGQLVQAILEDEERMSQEELAGWCDELGSLDDETLSQLLNDLLDDDVLEWPDADGRYRLRAVCEANQQWSLENGNRYIDKSDINRKKIAKAALAVMLRTSEPLCPSECAKKIRGLDALLVAEGLGKGLNDPEFKEGTVALALHDLQKAGILKARLISGELYYSPAIIGEGGL